MNKWNPLFYTNFLNVNFIIFSNLNFVVSLLQFISQGISSQLDKPIHQSYILFMKVYLKKTTQGPTYSSQ